MLIFYNHIESAFWLTVLWRSACIVWNYLGVWHVTLGHTRLIQTIRTYNLELKLKYWPFLIFILLNFFIFGFILVLCWYMQCCYFCTLLLVNTRSSLMVAQQAPKHVADWLDIIRGFFLNGWLFGFKLCNLIGNLFAVRMTCLPSISKLLHVVARCLGKWTWTQKASSLFSASSVPSQTC